jgi:flagellar hook protein FlgE
MSLLTALYAGASGLEASSLELSVVGDNIANTNTIGFKGSRAAFADAMAQSLIGDTPLGGGQRGLGVKLQVVQKILTQGSLVNTGLATDLGLEGSGFFAVKGSSGGQTGTFYTRAGQFTLDADGYLVTLAGLRVQGYSADPSGRIGSQLGDLQVGNASTLPLASTRITLKANLRSDAPIPTSPWDQTDPINTSNFASTATLFDSLGKTHTVDLYFRKTADGAWDWHALTDGGTLAGGLAGTATEIATGALTFGSSGELVSHSQTVNFNPNLAVNPQPLSFDFGDPTATGGTGLLGMTQFAAPSTTSFATQDGYSSGTLVRISIDTQGRAVGVFNNGQTRPLGQVAVADFEAPDQLARLGGNLFSQTRDSGKPTIGVPAEGGRGKIVAGALEQSNVDMASEFIRMIASHRAFQANSKTLTTADQLLAELMTIKR